MRRHGKGGGLPLTKKRQGSAAHRPLFSTTSPQLCVSDTQLSVFPPPGLATLARSLLHSHSSGWQHALPNIQHLYRPCVLAWPRKTAVKRHMPHKCALTAQWHSCCCLWCTCGKLSAVPASCGLLSTLHCMRRAGRSWSGPLQQLKQGSWGELLTASTGLPGRQTGSGRSSSAAPAPL